MSETLIYKAKSPLVVSTKKLNNNHYRVEGYKHINHLKPYEIANDIWYCYNNEIKIWHNAVDKAIIDLLNRFNLGFSANDTEGTIQAKISVLREKYGFIINLTDMNAGELVCDQNGVITMLCDIELIKVKKGK